MTEIVIAEIPPNTSGELEAMAAGVEEMRAAPQVEIKTKSFIHAGMYCRTCLVPKGVAIAGALIKIPTVIMVTGDFAMTCGGRTVRLKGTHIFRASAGRRQIFLFFFRHKLPAKSQGIDSIFLPGGNLSPV